MKYLLRLLIFNVFSLWLTSQILPAFIIPQGWYHILIAGFVFSLIMVIVRPILKILFIPLNILTFGLLSWCINVIVLLIFTICVPQVQVLPWTFSGIQVLGFVIPQLRISYGMNLILSSLTITTIVNILHTVIER